MFNRSKVPSPQFPAPSENGTTRNSQLETRNYYQVVISNAREAAERSQEQVIAEVVAELKGIWPEANAAKLLHSRMIVEHTAVFSPRPGSEDLRPVQQSPIANLQLAGDWTQTGWPATMEGAVPAGFSQRKISPDRSAVRRRFCNPTCPFRG